MIVKPYRDRDDDLAQLAALAARRDCTPRTREAIEIEIRKIRAGQKGERDAAYAIDFYLAPKDDWTVIHDLRLEWQGRVAQIDHLLINRFLNVWLCETKHFSDGVAINEQGEFTAFFKGKPRGIESPIEQNHRHARVLESVFGSSILPLPSRLGIDMRPTVRSVVLVSPQARISRPTQAFAGLETIIKSDQLRATINRTVEGMSVAETLLTATKIVGVETLGAFAKRLAALHRPAQFDWAGRFGMPPAEATGAAAKRFEHADAVTTMESPIAPRATNPISPSAPARQDESRLSTSKLAAHLGLSNARQLLDRLATEGLLVREGDGHSLTEKGRAAGGAYIEKSRYGPYFVWPAGLRLG